MVEAFARPGVFLMLAVLAPLSVGAAGPQEISESRVEEAIKKGIAYLKTADSPGFGFGVQDSDELMLLTFVHAGVPDTDPKFQELLKKILEGKLETTYEVSVQAMALEEIDRVKHQGRILRCAQFLLDNQCKNGQWSYGKPSIGADTLNVPTSAGSSASGGGSVKEYGPGQREKPKVVRRLNVKKSREGPNAGDNSNSQYAALGLRACHDAGIVFPRDAVALARKWWVESQISSAENAPVASGKFSGIPRGWCYRGYHHNLKHCKNPDQAYGSMTAGAVGALAIYDTLLLSDWKKDRAVLDGMAWMAANLTWTENARTPEVGGDSKAWLCYYFYAMERAGMLLELPKFGERDWYREGAKVLLDAQKASGAWLMTGGIYKKPTWDTCFAILFLKRATRPLVASVAAKDEKK